MKPLLIVFAFLIAFATTLRADEPTTGSIRSAVNRSIQWLETDMVTWRTEHGCSACHHGPMYLWSMHAAKRAGHTINESLLRDMTEWLLTNDKARIFPKSDPLTADATEKDQAADRMTAAMRGHNNFSQPTLYLTHALQAMPLDEPLRKTGWRKLAEHFASAQMSDGSFAGRKGWPPIFNTPQIHTLFAVTALTPELAKISQSRADNQHDPTTARSLHKTLAQAQRFLDEQTPDETHQALILRLLRLSQTARHNRQPDSGPSDIITALQSQQRADGGWSQTPDRPSDAFATGQTLYALRHAGLGNDAPAIQRGIEFLIRTQQSDGTWKMTSRPNPESGQPADFLNPITYAATAWATLGLVTCEDRLKN